MRAHAIVIPLMLFALTAAAQAPGEAAAYKKIEEARAIARRIGTGSAVRAFRRHAESFLEKFPDSGRRPTVFLWLGDLLKENAPREALTYYRRSTRPEAVPRAADLAFRFDPPPPLQVDRWVGPAQDPTRPDGRVTLLFFFSATHPSANPLTRRVEALATRLGSDNLRVIGIASVLDDHKQQTPERLAALVSERRLPFPVGIDRQRDRERSTSLALYRGNSVPWGLFLDRYGRIVWMGPLPVERNVFQRCETKLRVLLAEPSFETLRTRAVAGDKAAVLKLASIKTPESVGTLFGVRAGNAPKGLQPLIDKSLRAILPAGFSPADGKRWKDAMVNYRYSFDADRLIAK